MESLREGFILPIFAERPGWVEERASIFTFSHVVSDIPYPVSFRKKSI
jgi:hypothetical protein